MAKERLDSLLVEKGLADTRQKSKSLIMAGLVFVNGVRVDKAGAPVNIEAQITVKGNACPYVSRGGIKLKSALDSFGIDPAGKRCLDIGASTGGFTDCLLIAGATEVYCVDVGKKQLHWKLRNDSRVRNFEGINARFLRIEELKCNHFDIVVMDVSFISQTLILPVIKNLLDSCVPCEAEIITLVKPQFEAGRADVGKGGIVRDESVRFKTLEKIRTASVEIGFSDFRYIESPISGADGNREYLAYFLNKSGEQIKEHE